MLRGDADDIAIDQQHDLASWLLLFVVFAELTQAAAPDLFVNFCELTRDDSVIYMSDGTHQIRKLDPNTLQETGRIDVTMNGQPVAKLNELEFIKGEIWANVFETDRIVRIDPATGKVTGVLLLRSLLTPEERRQTDVLNGIAYDKANDKIYVTGKLWPKLFEIKVTDPAASAAQ